MNYIRKPAQFLFASQQKTHIFRKHTQNSLRLDGCAPHFRDFKNNVGDNVDTTVGALFKKWCSIFKKRSISEPVESVQYILAHSIGFKQVSDIFRFREKNVNVQDIKKIEFLCLQRLKNVPIQYVLGEWAFRQLNLKMQSPVFIPRPETEQLVDLVLEEVKENSKVLDLCCGSGAIGLSLLNEAPSIKVTFVDRSKSACQLTKENAQKNGSNGRIRVIQSQVERFQCEEKFNIIVSNPPYIFSQDLENLQPEIKLYEDLQALDGGKDGLDIIKQILLLSSRCLEKSGKLFMEVEPRQPGLIRDYLNNNLELVYIQTYKDFCDKDRFVEIQKSAK